MRRVYYAYTLKVASHPLVIHTLLLCAAAAALVSAVSVRSILHNLSTVEVGQVGTYIFNAFTHTEIWTLIFIAVIVLTLLSLRINLKGLRVGGMQTA
jgi:hypothetical protein